MANSSLLGYPSALSSTAYKLGKIAMIVTHQGKYPPAEPGALGSGPLEAAVGVADAAPIL
jgi:hypothetical protein